ncbi:ABC transporter permease [Actinoplanes couchii]|uniref:Transport permease protein n=1 Tax=Actinoplanes couchii TaxID=403638 RepID=A0ABQ3X5K3_9ACTN|nr:ABC transporter permease [Actinoplanes couchii]MDR6325499.1 ABC-2 type transport system permease protein [Actinoplanes couchii]GID53800.1 transport permease protein [Actinoplanes couchii]
MSGRLIRIGVSRGLIEMRQTMTTPSDLIGYAFSPVLLVALLFLIRDEKVPGSDLSLGAYSLVSSMAMLLVIGSLLGMAQYLAMDREDGTLLRAKAVPNGMVGYLIGRIVLVAGTSVFTCAVALIPGAFLVDGLRFDVFTAVTLLWLAPLGLLALMPLGAVLGSFFESVRAAALLMMPTLTITGISGIFYPISALPGWLQGVGQTFPMYWLGLGLRSAFLSDEPGQLWRAVLVLSLWAVAGLVLAPGVLRRMARRESGSLVAARRERALARTI